MSIKRNDPGIELNDAEKLVVKLIAKMRTDANKQANSHHNWGSVDSYKIDLEGFGAELAFCKKYNVYPDFTTHIRKGTSDCISPAGKEIDVKWTSKYAGELLIKKNKKKDTSDIYVLLIGSFPKYYCVGYATKKEVFSSPITNYGHGDNYTVKQSDLHDVVFNAEFISKTWVLKQIKNLEDDWETRPTRPGLENRKDPEEMYQCGFFDALEVFKGLIKE